MTDKQLRILLRAQQDDKFAYFCFYVAPTYDFIMELRKFGYKLEVLEPASLRETFKKDCEKMLNLYKD